MAAKLGHPYRASFLLTLFLKFPVWELHVKTTCCHVRVSFDETSQNQHPQGGPFPIPNSGWGILTTCGSKCSCALITRKSNAARDVLFVQETHPKVFQKLSHFRVPGQGQRSTPAARATGLTYYYLTVVFATHFLLNGVAFLTPCVQSSSSLHPLPPFSRLPRSGR